MLFASYVTEENAIYSFCCLHPRIFVITYIINIRTKYVRNVVCLESTKFFDGVKVCFCEQTDGNFNASETDIAISARICEYKQ
jgi:hypothetical protein